MICLLVKYSKPSGYNVPVRIISVETTKKKLFMIKVLSLLIILKFLCVLNKFFLKT